MVSPVSAWRAVLLTGPGQILYATLANGSELSNGPGAGDDERAAPGELAADGAGAPAAEVAWEAAAEEGTVPLGAADAVPSGPPASRGVALAPLPDQP
jgi:hypothetical protein